MTQQQQEPTKEDMARDLAADLAWMEEWHRHTAADGYGDIALARHCLTCLPAAIRRAIAAEQKLARLTDYWGNPRGAASL